MPRTLVTVAQLAERQPAFSENSLRWYIFNRKQNGLEATGAVLHMGRRVIVDEEKFLAWLDAQQEQPAESA